MSSIAEPAEELAFERLLSDYRRLLRSDLGQEAASKIEQAAQIMAQGSRRRLHGVVDAAADEDDRLRILSLFRPEEGPAAATSGSPPPVTV
jgi:hypothetical protein